MRMLLDPSWNTGTIPVRWCLEKEEQENILRNEMTDLYVVIDVMSANQGYSNHRVIAPLTDIMAYITFRRPGRNRVYMAVVCPSMGTKKSELVEFLRRKDGDGDHPTIFHNSEEDPSAAPATGPAVVVSWTYESVHVPFDYFAPEPPAWWKNYATRLAPKKMRDECDLRKWSLFAIFVQTPIIMPILGAWGVISSVFRALTAFFLGIVMGYRGIDWEPILHPFRAKLKYVWYDAYLHWQTRDKEGRVLGHGDSKGRRRYSSIYIEDAEGRPRPLFIQVLRPWILGTTLAFVYFLFTRGIASDVVQIIFLVIVVVYGVNTLIRLMERREHKKQAEALKQQAEAAEQEEAERQARLKELITEFSLFACDELAGGDGAPALGVRQLPKEKRTIYLRFQEAKGMVCKPFAS